MEHCFIGLMLSAVATTESGVAVLNNSNEIIFIDKLFTMNDIQHFFENFSSLSTSQVCISLPWDNTMLNGKWKVLSKLYQPIALNQKLPNNDNWIQRYSNRGSELFSSLLANGIKINRFELYLTRQALGLNSCFKERSPADCKALQNALRIKYGFTTLPTNMMPMAHLEALVGAVLAKKVSENSKIVSPIFEFNGVSVLRG